MRIATWNINSVRLRIHHVLRFIKEQNIDVMCLQETKTEDEHFPISQFINVGMKYCNFRGEKSYNGVAILSKIPIKENSFELWCGLNDTRHISVFLENNIKIHNFYVPAGGDEPNIKLNKKFNHKINFIKEMIKFFNQNFFNNTILVGDLNIAPFENDVWSHKQLLNVVSHTKIETDALKSFIKKGNFVDIIRKNFSDAEKIYTWWSYRNKDWKKSNRGRRLDHIFISEEIRNLAKNVKIFKSIRDWDKPSDHVPVMLELKI